MSDRMSDRPYVTKDELKEMVLTGSLVVTYGMNGFLITAEQIADGRVEEILAIMVPKLLFIKLPPAKLN